MSLLDIGAIAGVQKGNYFSTVDDSGSYINQSIRVIDSTGEFYIYFSYSKILSKHDTDGKVLWQKYIPSDDQFRMMYLLPGGDLLFAGHYSAFYTQGAIARFNPNSDTFSWYKRFSIGYKVTDWSLRFAFDSTETYGYLAFNRQEDNGDPNTDAHHANISRINLSNGTMVWSKEVIAPSGLRAYVTNIRTDSSGNLYFGGYYKSSTDGDYRGMVIKLNSSGTTLWQRELARNNTAQYTDWFFVEDIALDSSNNIQIAGIYRYDGQPVFGNAAYYTTITSAGTAGGQYGILPNPLASINFPTYLQTGYIESDGTNAYLRFYGIFDYNRGTDYHGTLIKINNNLIDFSKVIFFGDSITSGFSGPDAHVIDSQRGRMFFNLYRYLNQSPGPEGVTTIVPLSGNPPTLRIQPRSQKVNYEDVSAQLVAPPVTVSSGTATIRNITESYSFTDITPSAVESRDYNQFLRRYNAS